MVHTHRRTRAYGPVMTAPAPTAMNIGAFLSVSDLDALYTQPTREFGELIGRAGHTLVWGGSDPEVGQEGRRRALERMARS